MNNLPNIVQVEKIVSGNDNKLDEYFPSTSFSNFDFDPNQKKFQISEKCKKINGKLRFEANINCRTPYVRATRSTDFINIKNTPIATNYIYKWKPNERLTSKVVQAKFKTYKPPKRIEMITRPSSPYKVKADYETMGSNFHNEKRTFEMKRLQYLQAHTTWSIYPYAGIEEREDYNKKIRETLKEQIELKDRQYKKELENKILEYKIVSELDKQFKREDNIKKIEKAKYLMGYRDENKQLMEERWMQNFLLKRHEWHQESQLLNQDPINWSKTLR